MAKRTVTKKTSTSKKKSDSYKVKFITNPDSPILIIDGVWGSVSPTGDISCHFTVDTPSLPTELSFSIKPEQSGTQVESSRVVEAEIYRHVQSSVYMSPESAVVIAKWLIDQARIGFQRRNQK